MDIYELVSQVNGEIALGRARYRDENGEIIVLATLNGDRLQYTEAGSRLAATMTAAPKTPAPIKVRRRVSRPDIAGGLTGVE